MKRGASMPTDREWLVMEAVWEGGGPLTSAEILGRIDKAADLTARTARVLLHHLCKKGLLGYTVDPQDSRVYHYYALRSRESCLQEKSRDLIDTYFRGSGANAVAAFVRSASFTGEQLRELEELLKAREDGGGT